MQDDKADTDVMEQDATKKDGRPGRTSRQAEGSDEEVNGGLDGPSDRTPQGRPTPDQAEGEDEDA